MNKKFLFILSIIVIVLSSLLIFTYNNDFLYKDDIMRITKIKTVKVETNKNSLNFKEKHYYQKIYGVITNGNDKNKHIKLDYESTYSSVVTDKLKVGDKVFVDNDNIEGLKRDFYVVLMISIFILLLYIVGQFRGLLSVISVLFNIIIFYIGIFLYFKGINLLVLVIIESILFACLSLTIASGFNKKTLSAILSVIISIIFILILLSIVILCTDYSGVNFNNLSFLTIPPKDIILPELLIGSIGAITDVAITISSSISELIDKDSKISTSALNHSSKQIGSDIMSTMVNVLFFTYICAELPLFILAIRNGYSFSNFMHENITLEITRFLVGSIGIILTIPITTFISIKVFKGGS